MTGLNAAALVLAALIPGALFIWSFERPAGRFGIGLKDRALRLMGASAVLLSLFAWAPYWAYIHYWDNITNREPLPSWFWGLPILYTVIPWAAGSLLGHGWKRNWPWARFIIGEGRTPRAWDHLFQDQPAGRIHCKLKSGTWIGGVYAEANDSRPYTSGYPEPQDLYLPAMIDIDPETGQTITDEENIPIVLDWGVLLRWEDIEFLEFERLEDTNEQ